MKKLYTFFVALLCVFLFTNFGHTQCNYTGVSVNFPDACGDATTNTVLTLTFDVPMAGSTVDIVSSFDGSIYNGTVGIPGPNDVQFSFNLSHTMADGCAVEVHTFTIEPSSVCSDGITPVTDNGFTQDITVYPLQPSWEIDLLSTQVCSGDMITINILDGNGNFCTNTMITAPINQTCLVENNVMVDLDYEALLGIFSPVTGALGCWTNESGTFTNDPAGTLFEVFPEQPTWDITPGSEELCSQGMMSVDIYSADGTLCTNTMIQMPQNQTCDGFVDFDISGLIDFEALTGIFGPVGEGCWVNPTGVVNSDDDGTTFVIYPEPLTWQITPGFETLCSGDLMSIDILAADGSICTTVSDGVIATYTPNPNQGCNLITEATITIDYETYLVNTLGNVDALCGWVDEVGTLVTSDPAGTAFNILPEQFLWQVDASYTDPVVCGDGTSTIPLVLVAVDGTVCGTPLNYTVPQNALCNEVTDYAIDITLADMETMLGLGGELTGGQTCILPISTTMDLVPFGTPLPAHPDDGLIDWQVAVGTPSPLCSNLTQTDITIEITVGGVVCGTTTVPVPANQGCTVNTSIPLQITGADIENALGLTPTANCFSGFNTDVNTDPNYDLQILPEQFTVVDAGTPAQVCSDDPNAIMVQLQAADGTICAGAPLLFNAPSNLGCGIETRVLETVTVADIENYLGIPGGTGATCYSDITFDETIFASFEILPAAPINAIVTVLVNPTCSEDLDAFSLDLEAADGSTCPAGLLVDAPLNDGCNVLPDFVHTITVADIETALGIPPGVCTNYMPLNVTIVHNINPAMPSDYALAGPVPDVVCSGESGPVEVNIIAANGVDICDSYMADAPVNDGCEPLEDQPILFLYTGGDWLAATGATSPCGFSSFSEQYEVDVYPEPFTIDTTGGGQCDDLVANLVSASGITCYTQMKGCGGDTDMMMYNFTDPAAAMEYGDLIPWDVTLWPAACAPPATHFMGTMECLNCPEICGFSGAYPYWTSYCPDATIICDFEQFNPIMTCTPPTAVEDDDCEPEGNLCNGASTADNMSWFAFIAGSTTIDINFLQIDCESGSNFQAGIWDECICNGGACLVGQSSPCASNIDLLLTNAVIGETYYIFLDGCAGSQCNINITISQAPPFIWECPEVPEVDACDLNDFDFNFPDNSYCFEPGGILSLLFEMPQYEEFIGTLNSTFTWSMTSDNGFLPPPFDGANPAVLADPFVLLDIPDTAPGNYTICFESAQNDCDTTDDCAVPQCFDFQAVLLPDQDWGVVDVCYSVLAQGGYFPDMPPNGTWFWQGPPITPFDIGTNGSVEYVAINECGCEFLQTIQINIIDELDPIPYTVYLCEDDPCPSYPTQYGPITYCIDDANGDLIFLPGLAPSGCDLPVFLTVTGLILDGSVDTLSLSCNSMELQFNPVAISPIDYDLSNVTYVWTNPAGDTIGMDMSQLFTEEGNHCVDVSYNIFNEFNEETLCTDTYCYDIAFDEISVAAPTFVDPVLELCPGVPQTIIYELLDRGDNNTWTSVPDGLITNISGPGNTMATVDWDGVSGGRLCVIADNVCDGIMAESEETCIDIIVTPVQTYSIAVQDTICELLDSIEVSFVGDVDAMDSIAWDNGTSGATTFYQLTASGDLQSVSVFAIDTFGCEFAPVMDDFFVDDEKFLTISIPEPIVCLIPNVDVSFQVTTTGPGVFVPMAGLDTSTGIFNPDDVGPGTYTIEFVGSPSAANTNGCVAEPVSTTVRIVDTPQPMFTLESPICLGTTADVMVDPADTVGGIVYTWTTPNAISSLGTDNTSFDLEYTATGIFDVTLVTSVGQCISDPLTMQVEVLDTLSFPPFSCVAQGRDFVNFEWSVPPGVTEFNVSWTVAGAPGVGSPILGTSDNTLAVNNLLEDQEVIVTVTAISPNGCGDKTQVAACPALDCPEPDLMMDPITDICLDGTETDIQLTWFWGNPGEAPAMGDGGPDGFSGPGVDPVTGIFTPTTAGDFAVGFTYRNAIGCTFFATTTISVFDPPLADLVVADTICLGDQTTLQFNGNTVGVDFVWDFDNEIFNDQSPTNNSSITLEWDTPGTKNISVNTTLNTTATPCSGDAMTQVVVLDTIPAPVFDPCGEAGREFVTFSWQDVFSVNDGIPVTEYLITIDGSPIGVQDSTTYVASGLAEAQTVTITVTALDPNGCNDKTSTFECTSLFCRNDYVIPLTPAAVLCSNVDTNTFQITADVSGVPANEVGSGEFTVDPANGMIDNLGTFDPGGLAAGVYTVEYVYTNIIGCVERFTVDITINDPPSNTFGLPSIACVDEVVTVRYLGDPAGVTFTWDIGSGISPDLDANPQAPSYDISWSTAGVQTINLTVERDGCIETASRTIEVVGPADITLTGPSGPTCFDANTGIPIDVVVNTQTGTFDGCWEPDVLFMGDVFFPPTGDNATYELVYLVKEGNCETRDTINVEVLASPSVDASVTNRNICVTNTAEFSAFATGQSAITWDIAGGTLVSGDINSTGPIEVSWNNPGTYVLTAMVENGICTAMDTVSVVVEPELDPLNILCDEEITSITFTWQEINCADTYEVIVDGQSQGITDQETFTVNNLMAEQTVDFEVITISTCACPGFSNSVQCTSLPCPDYSVTFSQDSIGYCLGDFVSVDLNPQLSPAPTGTVTWSGPGVNQGGVFNSNGIPAGEYVLTYSYVDNNGVCTFEDRVVLIVSDIPQFNVSSEDPTCYLDNFGVIMTEVTDGFGPFTLSLGSENTVFDSDVLISNIAPGTYTFEVTDGVGCVNTGTFVINEVIEPSATINGAAIQTVGTPEEYQFSVQPSPESFGVVEFDSIVWTFNQEILCASTSVECETLILDYNEEANDTLCVQLFYNDGCFIETCQPVRVREIKQFYVPNIFSPNGDETNDDFRFYTNDENAIVYDIAIYDRWGNLLSFREMNTILDDGTMVSGELVQRPDETDSDVARNDVYLWDGRVANNNDPNDPRYSGDPRVGEQVQPGVFVYKIRYLLDPNNPGSQIETIAGDITVIR